MNAISPGSDFLFLCIGQETDGTARREGGGAKGSAQPDAKVNVVPRSGGIHGAVGGKTSKTADALLHILMEKFFYSGIVG